MHTNAHINHSEWEEPQVIIPEHNNKHQCFCTQNWLRLWHNGGWKAKGLTYFHGVFWTENTYKLTNSEILFFVNVLYDEYSIMTMQKQHVCVWMSVGEDNSAYAKVWLSARVTDSFALALSLKSSERMGRRQMQTKRRDDERRFKHNTFCGTQNHWVKLKLNRLLINVLCLA